MHLSVHVQALGHHHHADDSLHMADEVESDKHFHADSGPPSFGLHSSNERAAFAVLPGTRPSSVSHGSPSVVPDGLFRPPQEQA